MCTSKKESTKQKLVTITAVIKLLRESEKNGKAPEVHRNRSFRVSNDLRPTQVLLQKIQTRREANQFLLCPFIKYLLSVKCELSHDYIIPKDVSLRLYLCCLRVSALTNAFGERKVQT